MKIYYSLLLLGFALISLDGQERYSDLDFREYDKTDFGTHPNDEYLIEGICNYKELGCFRTYFFPRDKQWWEEFQNKLSYDNRKDSLRNIISKHNFIDFFDVYAFWVDKKYTYSEEETADNEKGYATYYYYRIDTIIDYDLYKLTDKGWLWLQHGKEKPDETFSYYTELLFLPYLSDDMMPHSMRDTYDTSDFVDAYRSRFFHNTFITPYLMLNSTKEDLALYDKSQLRLIRNAIFARKGYQFKSKDLQDYFHQFRWYRDLFRKDIKKGDFPSVEEDQLMKYGWYQRMLKSLSKTNIKNKDITFSEKELSRINFLKKIEDAMIE